MPLIDPQSTDTLNKPSHSASHSELNSLVVYLQLMNKYGQSVTPATDGVTTDFIVPSSYISGSLRVYREGERLRSVTELTNTTFRLISAPDADEEIWVDYIETRDAPEISDNIGITENVSLAIV